MYVIFIYSLQLPPYSKFTIIVTNYNEYKMQTSRNSKQSLGLSPELSQHLCYSKSWATKFFMPRIDDWEMRFSLP